MKKLFFLLLSFVFSIGILLLINESSTHRADEIGLGDTTLSYFPHIDGYSIHGNNSMSELHGLKKGWEKRGKKEVYLWLGNSQLHGINQMKPGDRNCVEIAFNRFAREKKGIEVIGFSLPNANLQEFLVAFAEARHEMTLGGIVVSVCFDDLREDGIRDELLDDPCDTLTLKELSEIPVIGARLLNELKADESGKKKVEKNYGIFRFRQPFQETSEACLEYFLADHFSLWKRRPDFRAFALLSLYNFRNTVFQIKPDSIRFMIPGRYQANLAALAAILRLSKKYSIKTLLYIPPIRDDVPLPYDTRQYSTFKEELFQMAGQYDAQCVNLESIVSPEYWGFKEGTSLGVAVEIDYMHFQAHGHKLLADAIVNLLEK